MANYVVGDTDVITLLAGEDLTGDEMKIVKGNGTDHQVVLASAVTDRLLGVLYSGAGASAAGLPVSVQVNGVAKVKAGGTINQGDLVTTDANAAVVTAEGAAVGLKYILGYALQDAASGDVISVLLKQGPYNTAVN